MQDLGKKNNEISITLNTDEMTPTQIRLIKSINSLLGHVLIAEDENEYFEISSDLIKKTAELIQHASFAEKNKNMAYGEQAVEFAVDFLHDAMDLKKIHNIDN